VNRKRQAVVGIEGSSKGKEAITHYRVAERFRAHTFVNVQLETGRTHQIRVHMAHIHYPLVGDPVYGGRLRIPPNITPEFDQILRNFKRQALHAASLGFVHPLTGEHVSWQAELPEDMQQLLAACREDLKRHR
jgi:23S rRNA pseudouridine1911/1915/1917 synthase